MRAFVAINLPARLRFELHSALAPLRDLELPVKWTRPESLHLTLEFLGNIDERQATTVKGIVGRVAENFDAFEMELAGIGAFPGFERARVFWVGIVDQPILSRLHQQLETGLESVGFPREQRAFSPHVTIGHSRRGAGRAVRQAQAVARAFDFRARVRVVSVDLMESHLSPGGSQYERLLAAALRQPVDVVPGREAEPG